MARTLAAAIAAVDSPRFDEAVGYTVRRPKAAPVDPAFTVAFAGVDPKFLQRVASGLARHHRCQPCDAEEALSDSLLALFIKRPDLYREDPRSWLSLLREVARFRLLEILGGRGHTASIEALHDKKGDAAFKDALHCVPASHSSDEHARHELPSAEGEPWSQTQILGAFQRFRDHHGRPPRTADCRVLNGLPSLGVIYRHFESFADAVLAAGMVPSSPRVRRREWKPLEAARACRSFYRRRGYWPSSSDARRCRGELPGEPVMVRYFGGKDCATVQRGAAAILAGTDTERGRRHGR